jgi:cytochrome c-type biogenesis protein CcmF
MAYLGRGLILMALVVSAVGAVAGIAAGSTGSAVLRRWTFRLCYAFFALMLAATGAMEYALLARDFSVGYVAHVGSREVPTWVAIVSLWSSLEGSILFWGLILGTYIGLVAFLNRKKHPEHMPYALGVMMAAGVFFTFLIAGPADPFKAVFPVPDNGPGPNPLLQNHILMVIHPPMLYAGYVGMCAPFALAAAALFTGKLGQEFIKPLRTWLLVPWVFLTIGITLGGWWAYEVLGWGGYWAWDPVENASLLPWLTATAALHSLLVVERRGLLKGWTLTLILASFLLTILGTFMTRSGIFNSVHAFSQSDIGPTFLAFLATSLLFSVLLLSSRIGLLEAEGRVQSGLSREGAFLVNNLLFVTLTLTVLLGTVFPLVVEAVKGARISVGEPYFNRMGVPLGVAVLFLMGIGPALPWGAASGRQALRALLPGLAAGAATAAFGFALGARSFWLIATLFVGGYSLEVTLAQIAAPALARLKRGARLVDALVAPLTQGRRRLGGYAIHAGMAVLLIAVATSSSLKQHAEVSLKAGESSTLGSYRFTFTAAETRIEPHRQSTLAHFDVQRDGRHLTQLAPRMNQYFAMREPVGTPDVHSDAREDFYLSVMGVDAQKQTVAVRAFLTPMVVWIWLGAGIAVLGAVLSLWPASRRRRREPALQPTPSAHPEPKPLPGAAVATSSEVGG